MGQNKASINASIKTAKMLERKGDVDGAIAIYEAVLLKDPKNHRTIRDMKSILKINQRYDEGILFIRERLIHTPNDIQLYSELGELYFLNGQQKDAKTIWTAGAEKFKNNRPYYQIMVSLYGRLSLDKELISLLDTGREKFGQSFMAYEAGIHYQTRRVYDKAMDQFILHLSHEPKKNVIIQRRILLMSDDEDAVPIIENKLKIASQKHPDILLNVLSEFYFKQREYDRAFDVKKDGSESGKINFNDWLTFANECRKENQFKISIEAYNFILGQKINSNWAGKALLGLAQTFEDQIIPIQESHLIPYFFDNNLFFEDPFQLNSTLSSEHLESSLALYDSLLISLPKSPLLAEAYFRLGEIKYRILHDFDQAYNLLHKAMQNRPDKRLRLKIVLRIADVLMAKGQSKEALTFLNRQLSFISMSPIDPSFNDLMELKNILTQYYNNEPSGKITFQHFLKAEWYLRQRKIGDAIRELNFLSNQDSMAAIAPLAMLRRCLLHYRLKEYDKSLNLAISLEGTPLADRGIILAGQIYETKYLDVEKAMEQYMRILDEFPKSIFSEPIRYHIRTLQQTES